MDEQLKVFNNTLMNIFSNYIPNKYIICDDKDPVWMNEKIKEKINSKNHIYKNYVKQGRKETDFVHLERSIKELNNLIVSSKESYYRRLGMRLNDPKLQVKTYWSIMKTFYNEKKIPLIPPLLVNGQFVTDVKTKANIFNKFFCDQCTPLDNTSSLPLTQSYLTNKRLTSVHFTEDDILKVVRALDINKAHGHDDISIRMIKMCDSAIIKPLALLFCFSMMSCVYPDQWKKGNIIPVHKKMISSVLIIITLFPSYPFVEKYLRSLFLMKYLSS